MPSWVGTRYASVRSIRLYFVAVAVIPSGGRQAGVEESLACRIEGSLSGRQGFLASLGMTRLTTQGRRRVNSARAASSIRMTCSRSAFVFHPVSVRSA